MAGDSTGGLALFDIPFGAAGSVALSSSDPHVIVPSAVNVSAGRAQSDVFAINTTIVASSIVATLSVTFNGVTKTASISVQFAAFGISCQTPVVSGHNSTGTVTLAAPAPNGGYKVTLFSQGASIKLPASATVSQGATTATFPITVYGVNATGQQAFYGIVGGLSRVAYITITPAPLLNVQLATNTLAAGQSTTGRAFLDGMNGSHPQTVTLSSNNPNVTVPASVVIPNDGRLSFAFTVTANSQATGTATISATLNGVTKTTVLTVN